jgi:acetyltransferase-like isoleucine patch superfamily enzyme
MAHGSSTLRHSEIQTLTLPDVVGWVWRLFRPDGSTATDALLFLPDGSVKGYQAPDEHGWKIDNGVLCFTDMRGAVATRFTDVVSQSPLTLTGQYRDHTHVNLRLQRNSWTERPTRDTDTRIQFHREIEVYGWQIGRHTYGRPSVLDRGDDILVIGNFTSIADGVQIALSNHQTRFVSSYPFGVLRSYWPSVPMGVEDHVSKGAVTIGSDVWIGANAFIGSGVTVGHGAVIGAHAVVTKDVPPYSICVGNPARTARFRFDEDEIRELLSICWWDWPDEKIDRFLPFILSEDVGKFIGACQATHDFLT